jgi:hypothetical protein
MPRSNCLRIGTEIFIVVGSISIIVSALVTFAKLSKHPRLSVVTSENTADEKYVRRTWGIAAKHIEYFSIVLDASGTKPSSRFADQGIIVQLESMVVTLAIDQESKPDGDGYIPCHCSVVLYNANNATNLFIHCETTIRDVEFDRMTLRDLTPGGFSIAREDEATQNPPLFRIRLLKESQIGGN